MTKVALFYIAGSLVMLVAAPDDLSAQALGMGAIFGVGQIASAVCLRRCNGTLRAETASRGLAR